MQQQNKFKFSNIFRAIFFNKKSMNTILDYSLVFHLAYFFTLMLTLPTISALLFSLFKKEEIYFSTTVYLQLLNLVFVVLFLSLTFLLFVLLKKKFGINTSNKNILIILLFTNSVRAYTSFLTPFFNGFLISSSYFIYSIFLVRLFFLLKNDNKAKTTWYVVIVYGGLLFFIDLLKYPLAFIYFAFVK